MCTNYKTQNVGLFCHIMSILLCLYPGNFALVPFLLQLLYFMQQTSQHFLFNGAVATLKRKQAFSYPALFSHFHVFSFDIILSISDLDHGIQVSTFLLSFSRPDELLCDHQLSCSTCISLNYCNFAAVV